MPYVYVKIPNVEAFRDFLINHAIHEYAVVQRKTGGNMVHCFYRLTAKLANREEIAVCDIPYWQGFAIEFEAQLEQVNQKRDKEWTKIENKMSSGEVVLPGAEDKTRRPDPKNPDYSTHFNEFISVPFDLATEYSVGKFLVSPNSLAFS